MNKIAERLDTLLKEAGIGRAFVFLMREKKSNAEVERIIISSYFDDKDDLRWLISSAKQLLGDDMEIVYRYDDMPDDEFKAIFYACVITGKSAEKICERFSELESNQTIHPKYREPSYPDKYGKDFFI